MLAGVRGSVTNLPVESVLATQVISAYYELWQLEALFRMMKSDLRARPSFHNEKGSDQRAFDRDVRGAGRQPALEGTV